MFGCANPTPYIKKTPISADSATVTIRFDKLELWPSRDVLISCIFVLRMLFIQK
jgi:hypothetical protein